MILLVAGRRESLMAPGILRSPSTNLAFLETQDLHPPPTASPEEAEYEVDTETLVLWTRPKQGGRSLDGARKKRRSRYREIHEPAGRRGKPGMSPERASQCIERNDLAGTSAGRKTAGRKAPRVTGPAYRPRDLINFRGATKTGDAWDRPAHRAAGSSGTRRDKERAQDKGGEQEEPAKKGIGCVNGFRYRRCCPPRGRAAGRARVSIVRRSRVESSRTGSDSVALCAARVVGRENERGRRSAGPSHRESGLGPVTMPLLSLARQIYGRN